MYAASNKVLNLAVNELREGLATMTASWKEEEMNHQIHKQITDSLKTDRDRYTVLYLQELKLRQKYEEKGDNTVQLLYEVQKELADRRIKMGFSDNILAGK